jgi:hypothetical protein
MARFLILGNDRKGKARSSFLKKRSKKLFVFRQTMQNCPRQRSKVFWFFFSKKNMPSLLWH